MATPAQSVPTDAADQRIPAASTAKDVGSGTAVRLCWSEPVSATSGIPLSSAWFGRLLDLVLTNVRSIARGNPVSGVESPLVWRTPHLRSRYRAHVDRHPAVFLPGGVLPADPAYAALLQVLGDRVDAAVKDLEVYSGDRPAADYGLGTEVEGILREADAHGFDRFHLVGYSGGGASSLAFAAVHGYRLLSLALLEPAWAGNERTAEEEGLMQRFRALEPLPPDQFMAGFVGLQLAPGVEPPPPPEGPPPPWMAKRPAGLRAILQAFDSGDLDVDVLRTFDRPVYFALGGRSNPDYYGRMANRLTAIFPDFTIEIFPERHHFDPPHRIEPDRLAGSLLALWQRAGSVGAPA